MDVRWILLAAVLVCAVILAVYLYKKKSSGGNTPKPPTPPTPPTNCKPACEPPQVCVGGVCKKASVTPAITKALQKLQYMQGPLSNLATQLDNIAAFPGGAYPSATCMQMYATLKNAELGSMVLAYHNLQSAVLMTPAAIVADGGKSIQTAAIALQQASSAAQTAFRKDFIYNPVFDPVIYCGTVEVFLKQGLDTFVSTSAQLMAAANALVALISSQ